MVTKESFSISGLIKDPAEVASKIQSNIETDVGHRVARSVAKPTDKIKDVTTKDRIRHSMLSGLISLAANPILSKIIARNKKISVPLLLANTAASAATGYFTPDIANIIRREVRGDISKKEAKKLIRDLEEPSRKTFKETKEISELYGGLKKQSSVVGKTLGFARKGISGAGSLLWKGMFPGRNPSFGRKALSFGVRSGALAGAGYGTYKGVRYLSGPRSGSNYTTFLRNQLLAGNIQPGELSQRDLVSVRRLGMK